MAWWSFRTIPFVLVLAGCPRDAPTWTGTVGGGDDDDTIDTIDTTDTTDTVPPTDGEAPIDRWTPGPDLPPCTPAAGDPDRVALSGVVLLPTGVEAGLVVVDRTSGTIACAGASCTPDGATVVCTDGVIAPALIDTHDHGQYNIVGPWQHDHLFSDRYDWQGDFDYYDFREAYDGVSGVYMCESMKWAELREIVGGSTSIAGSYGDACIDVLARDLDAGAVTGHDIAGYDMEMSAQQVWYYDATDAADRVADLASGAVDVYVDHVAEGIGGTVRAEIGEMEDLGMVGPGNMFIHATDATVEQLARMTVDGTGIVWSPRSNLDLYGQTTLADVGYRMGLPVTLGPDWTWSGSNRVPAELSCARDYLVARRADATDQDLFEWVTLDAAAQYGLQGQLGMLVAGAKADVAVFAWSAEPYRAVIESGYEDVRLVMIDGYARYGVPGLVAGIEANPAWCESVTACTEPRTLCVAEADTGSDAQTYDELESILTAAFALETPPAGLEYSAELYPLWACDEVRPSCDPRAPTAGDTDGDGVDDGADGCRFAWDPTQTDHDLDGIGDACDACPLTSEPACTHDPDDIDDDGQPNASDGCPYVADPGNPDADDDGHADACDPCPDVPNPGGEACPATIRALRDPNDPAHPDVETEVTLHDVVVTGSGATGVFVQDPAEDDYAALYLYGGAGALGDVVTVTGTYTEYYGLTEINVSTMQTTGTAAVPAPIVVGTTCDVGAGGVDAEKYESMLVTVSDLDVTDDNPDATDYNEFEVEGCLRVDDLLCPTCWLDQPPNGTHFTSITGPLYYGFSATHVVPRTAADLVP